MKQEEGKSSVKLIIGIVVIIIAIIGIVQYAKYYINKEKVKNLQADLLLVQAIVEIAKANNNLNKEENPLRGYQLTQLPEGINITEFLEKNVVSQDEYEKYYLLDSAALEQIGLQELVNKYPGYFIVNYENYEVVYTEGYENENKMWCYKISDLHKMPENKKIENNQNEQVSEENNEQEKAEEKEE